MRSFITCFILVLAFYHVATGRDTIDSRIAELDRRMALSEKRLNDSILKSNSKIQETEKSIGLKDEIVEVKKEIVSNWLNFFSIVFGFFGIFIPILTYLLGSKFFNELNLKTQLETAKIKEIGRELEIQGKAYSQSVEVLIRDIENQKIAFSASVEGIIKEFSVYVENEKSNARILSNFLSSLANAETIIRNSSFVLAECQNVFNDSKSSQYEKDLSEIIILFIENQYQRYIDASLLFIFKYRKNLDLQLLSNINYQISFCYLHLKDNEKSLKHSTTAVEIDPENLFFVPNHSLILMRMKRYSDSIKFLERAYSKGDRTFPVFNNLSVCHSYIGNYQEALKIIDDGIGLFQNSFLLKFNKVEILFLLGQIQDSLSLIDALQKSNYHPGLKYILDIFKIIANLAGNERVDLESELSTLDTCIDGGFYWDFGWVDGWFKGRPPINQADEFKTFIEWLEVNSRRADLVFREHHESLLFK